MTRIRVFVLLLLALNGVLCDVSQAKDRKRTEKSVEWKKTEKKNEKRDSSDSSAIYNLKQKDEPFRPIYQYQYQGGPYRASTAHYVTAATHPQISYSKPDSVITIGGGPSHHGGGGAAAGSIAEGSTASIANNGGIQYASPGPYKAEGGIHYAPSGFKSASNSVAGGGGGIQYASSAYRGPFIATYQPATAGQVKVQPGPIYAPPPSSVHPPAAVTLPLHYGGFEQQLPPQHHQQNQYAIAFPSDYVRHYQQNLAAPYPLHGAHMVPLVYTAAPAPLTSLKDQAFKHSAVHYISLTPQQASSLAAASPSPASGQTLFTHFIPFYGMGPQHHQQIQHQSPVQYYYGGHHQQAPATFAYSTLPGQQQAIQIAPKHQQYGPIQMATIGASAAATVPIIPFKPIVGAQHQHQQQLQQSLHHFHQHYHPSATSYTRYSQGLSGGSSSGGAGNSIEVPASDTSSSSALKLGPLYSTSSSTNSGNIYAGATGGGSGKMPYTYASDGNSVGPVYSHPGAIHYGTHLYHPPTKVVEIGSNRVTAGSAIIAGVAPPAYHPQQQSAAGNSHGGGGGAVGSSSPVVKFH